MTMKRINWKGKQWSRGKVEHDSGRETEVDNRRSHPGSYLIVHQLSAAQMGRLTPVRYFKSSCNGPQFRWATGKGAILAKVTQFLCCALLFQPLSVRLGGWTDTVLLPHSDHVHWYIYWPTEDSGKVNYGERGRPCGNVMSVWTVCMCECVCESFTLYAFWK